MANFDPDAVFMHEGVSIDYTPGSDVAAGEVVDFTSMIGVAAEAIPAGREGALQIEGVFALKKGAATYAVGDTVGWTGTVVGVGSIGVVVKAAATNDPRVWVKLTPGMGS